MNITGNFPSFRVSSWNGHFRDTVRRAVKSDEGQIADLATRIAGSSDLFQYKVNKRPTNSINYVASHDGLTLNDLVTYNNDGQKSWNCGVNGPTSDPNIENLRKRQIKNMLTLLFVSQGVPMLMGGDEFRRTQSGNDNAYNQDNEISWFNWELLNFNKDIFNFTKSIIAFRQNHKILRRSKWFEGRTNKRNLKDLEFYGTLLLPPNWSDKSSRSLSFTLGDPGDDEDIHVMLNFYWESLDFQVPKVPGRSWFRAIDTNLPSGLDIQDSPSVPISDKYSVAGRSIVVLVSRDTTVPPPPSFPVLSVVSPAVKKITGVNKFLEQLIHFGVKYIFGNPGTTEENILDGISSYNKDLTYVLGLHEGIPVGIADAYARASGTIGVIQLHSGVGLGNGTGLLYQVLIT